MQPGTFWSVISESTYVIIRFEVEIHDVFITFDTSCEFL